MLASSKTATELSSLIPGYSLCAQTETKSPNTTAIVISSVSYLSDFPSAEGLSTEVTQVNIMERRVKEYRRHTRPMDGFKSSTGAVNVLRIWLVEANARMAKED